MKKLAILAAMLGAAVCCMASEPVKLSLNLEKGSVYGLSTEASSKLLQNVFDQELDITTQIKVELLFRVEDADDEGYDMSVWYERLAMKMSGPSEMSGDSESLTADNPLSAMMKAMTRKPFMFRMTRRGNIVYVKGTEKMLDVMIAEMHEQFPGQDESGAEFMKKQMANFYGGEFFKNSIESGMVVFPDEPVSIGDSWNRDLRTQAQFTMNVKMVFTVTGIDDNGITIKGEAVITTDPDEAPTNMNGVDMKYDMEGTMTTETVLDTVSGWTISGKTVQEMSGKMKMLPGVQMPNGITVSLTIYNNTAVTGKAD